MDIRYAVRVFAFKDNKVACIKYKNINKDYLIYLVERLKMVKLKYRLV